MWKVSESGDDSIFACGRLRLGGDAIKNDNLKKENETTIRNKD